MTDGTGGPVCISHIAQISTVPWMSGLDTAAPQMRSLGTKGLNVSVLRIVKNIHPRCQWVNDGDNEVQVVFFLFGYNRGIHKYASLF